MDIRIQRDCYHLCLNPYHIEEAHVVAAVEHPEGRKIVDLGESEHELFFGALQVSPHVRGLLVHAIREKDPEAWVVIAAYWLPLTDEAGTDPLVLLQQLARRFGFPICVGTVTTHFISRQSITIPADVENVREVIGYQVPEGADFLSLPLVRRTIGTDGAHFLEVALVYAINTLAYREWLDQVFEPEQVSHHVHPELPLVSLADLVGPEGTLPLVVRLPFDDLSRQLLLGIEASGSIAMGFEGGFAFIERNGMRASVEYTGEEQAKEAHVVCFFIWSRTALSVHLMSIGEDSAATAPTCPPNRLQGWLDRKTLWPRKHYSSEEEVFAEVLLLVQRLQEQVSSLNLQRQFWRDWQRGEPKIETELQPLIHALLADRSRLKQLEVVSERVAGAGRLDFAFSGVLVSGGRATVCVECKLAHSGMLVHGLTRQLPSYMRALQTDHGIYCVIFFGSGSGRPASLSTPESVLDRLQHAVLVRGVQGIRPVILDVTLPTPPSKAT